MTPVWAASGVEAKPLSEHHPKLGVLLHLARYSRNASLPPELCRSLASWLLWWVGDRPEPADPDRVRAAVDEQRAVLAELSSGECTEDYRAGLAWASRALDEIAAAAS